MNSEDNILQKPLKNAPGCLDNFTNDLISFVSWLPSACCNQDVLLESCASMSSLGEDALGYCQLFGAVITWTDFCEQFYFGL